VGSVLEVAIHSLDSTTLRVSTTVAVRRLQSGFSRDQMRPKNVIQARRMNLISFPAGTMLTALKRKSHAVLTSPVI